MTKNLTIKRMFLIALAGWGILTLYFVGDPYQAGESHAQVVEAADVQAIANEIAKGNLTVDIEPGRPNQPALCDEAEA